jgi:hypothetical protein
MALYSGNYCVFQKGGFRYVQAAGEKLNAEPGVKESFYMELLRREDGITELIGVGRRDMPHDLFTLRRNLATRYGFNESPVATRKVEESSFIDWAWRVLHLAIPHEKDTSNKWRGDGLSELSMFGKAFATKHSYELPSRYKVNFIKVISECYIQPTAPKRKLPGEVTPQPTYNNWGIF